MCTFDDTEWYSQSIPSQDTAWTDGMHLLCWAVCVCEDETHFEMYLFFLCYLDETKAWKVCFETFKKVLQSVLHCCMKLKWVTGAIEGLLSVGFNLQVPFLWRARTHVYSLNWEAQRRSNTLMLKKKKKKNGWALEWGGTVSQPSPLLFLSSPSPHLLHSCKPLWLREERPPFQSLYSPPLFPLPELTVGTIKTLKRGGWGKGGKEKKAEE